MRYIELTTTMSKPSRRKEVIKAALSWIMVVVAISMMMFTIFSVSAFNRSDRNLFGYKFFVAQTSSMAATDFKAGDVVVSKTVSDMSTLAEGDIITFVSQDEHHYGKIVTHKIRDINIDEHGKREFLTYGTTTNTNDKALVPEKNVIGKYSLSIPNVGTFFVFLKTVPGYIACILIPFVFVIVWHGIDCWYFLKKYKQLSEETEEVKMILSRKA